MREYKLTDKEYAEILDASKATPVMYLSGGASMFDTPQNNANRAWKKFGEKYGFKYMTVKPGSRGDHYFLAEEN